MKPTYPLSRDIPRPELANIIAEDESITLTLTMDLNKVHFSTLDVKQNINPKAIIQWMQQSLEYLLEASGKLEPYEAFVTRLETEMKAKANGHKSPNPTHNPPLPTTSKGEV